MKKNKLLEKLIIFILLFIPINIYAYSEYIIPGGENIGIEVNSDGVLVVGFYKINNSSNKTPSYYTNLIISYFKRG